MELLWGFLKHNQDNLLFKDIPKTVNVWMSHGDKVNELSKNWQSLAISDNNIIAAISHKENPIYGVQFHPEVTHTEFGTNILSNFCLCFFDLSLSALAACTSLKASITCAGGSAC